MTLNKDIVKLLIIYIVVIVLLSLVNFGGDIYVYEKTGTINGFALSLGLKAWQMGSNTTVPSVLGLAAYFIMGTAAAFGLSYIYPNFSLRAIARKIEDNTKTTIEQEIELKRLNDLVESLYKQGSYEYAVVMAKKSLLLAEQTFGSDHPNVALSLNNLGKLYYSQGKYAQAEPIYRRSLTIREQALGLDHPYTAKTLENMALLFRETNREKEAKSLEERVAAIYEIKR